MANHFASSETRNEHHVSLCRNRIRSGLISAVCLGVTLPAAACPTITRSELTGDRLRIEGTDAVPGATMTIDGVAMGTADGNGDFRLEQTGYTPPDDCVVSVSDGACNVEVTLSGCTPSGGGGGGGGGTPPCTGLPPVPGPGEAVTWSAANSPYQICVDVTIPAGANVTIEPGVTVNIDPTILVVVDGALIGQGTGVAPIAINGGKMSIGGALNLAGAVINSFVEPASTGSLIFQDCTFLADQQAMLSEITQPTYIWDNPPLVLLEGGTFVGDGSAYEFFLDNCHVGLRDVAFTGTDVTIWDSYVYLDNVILDGGTLNLSFLNVDGHQDVFLDRLTVKNNLTGPGISVAGANALLGTNNTLVNNLYPVAASGLLSGSVVPATGNAQNMIASNGFTPGSVWSNVGLPWLYTTTSGCTVLFPNIEPGVTVKMGPGASICNQGGTIQVRGLPGAPITFEPLDPLQPWGQMVVGVSYGSRIDECVFDGAGNIGLIVTNGGAQIKNSVFRNCNIGTNANTFATSFFEKTRFINNAVAVSFSDLGHPELNSPTNPNAFEGNTVALDAFEFGSSTDAANCWWNHPTGPQAPGNPGGQGDVITGSGAFGVTYQPFLTAPPDLANHPPVVRLRHNDHRSGHPLYAYFEPGTKLIVEWDAFDDDTIVEQRLLFSPSGDFPTNFQLLATLPPTQRSVEWTAPDVGFIVNGAASYLRVVAVDAAGQIGWDDIRMLIPSGRIHGTGVVTSDFGGQTFRAGQALPTITWTFTPDPDSFSGSPSFYILLDGDEKAVGLGGGGSGSWTFTDSPFASTDTARIGVRLGGTTNDVFWFFGDYFSLRPDPALGDAPPTVALTAPAPGAVIPAGSVVSMTWTASDDEALQSFNVQASFDGGRIWRTIGRDLPATATGFDWPLPPGDGIADLRLRVIAKDRRLQDSSDTVAVTIAPSVPAVPGDLDGDGDVDELDVGILVNVLTGVDEDPGRKNAADLNGDGTADGNDIAPMIAVLMD